MNNNGSNHLMLIKVGNNKHKVSVIIISLEINNNKFNNLKQ